MLRVTYSPYFCITLICQPLVCPVFLYITLNTSSFCSLYRKVLLGWCSVTSWGILGLLHFSIIWKTCLIFIQLIHGCSKINYDCSAVDEVAKEKLGPFATLSDNESYQSRDLEKVWEPIKVTLLIICTFTFG